jgi:uncharacterized protein (DUF433 family)
MDILLQRITVNPAVSLGKPCIRNMRFTVTHLLELLASGMTFDEILEDYPYLETLDIQACLLYASQMSKTKSVTFLNAVSPF